MLFESRRASTVSSNRAKVIMNVLSKRGYATSGLGAPNNYPDFSNALDDFQERENSKNSTTNDL